MGYSMEMFLNGSESAIIFTILIDLNLTIDIKMNLQMLTLARFYNRMNMDLQLLGNKKNKHS